MKIEIERDELTRLKNIERRVNAMFGQSVPEAVALHVAIALESEDHHHRMIGLARAASYKWNINDKLLSAVIDLRELAYGNRIY